MESNMPLTRCVQVRSPSLNQTLSFPFDHATTVDSLKQSIQTQHPYHPSPGDQRIIYRGKILLDTEILSNILEKCDNSTLPTFHLVVKPSLSDTIPTTTPTPTAPINTTDTDTMARPVPPSYSAHNTFIPATATETPIINSQLSGFPSLVPGGYQVIAINGQFYLAPVLVPSYPTTTTPAIATAAAAATAATTNLAPPPPDQARMAERPRVLTRRATLWLALKLAFALFITCHGASIERILFLHFLALVFFMYRTGRFRVVIRRVTLGELQGRFQPAQQQRGKGIPSDE
ncbi:hypothetical protein BC941DRAFT_252620 [Chlamydoabsidia padenii]|nr:hypothetical protein BC941DRAFT_252620 [Chlamydoabsidia padenii]